MNKKTHVAAFGLVAVILSAMPSRAEDGGDYAKIIAEAGPAFVTVKFVLKMEGQFGNRESEAEITGVMVDAGGLVLCGNTRFGSPRMMRQIGGSATPTDIKVLIGDDTEGLEAKVLARDSELDLAWVQIKKPGDKKFAFVDLAKSATPEVGQRVMTLRKMAKYFDRVLTVGEGRIAGKTKKPRDLFVPSGLGGLEPGLPVFATNGQVIGISVVQMPEDEELQGMAFTGIGRDISNGLILPTSEVVKATARAKEAGSKDKDEDDDEDKAKKPDAKKKAKATKSADDEEDGDKGDEKPGDE
ncbi:MAG: trypsin-like peptidase domain-containing protein [Planctomycetes bacterium]|nr:trypsin-like peptidase domain-containing protein [Planctomycetota bacterium]